VIRGEAGFEAMLKRLYPAADGAVSLPCELVPQGWFGFCADACARLFPSLWKRRCLFCSLIILDWSRRFGIHPTLNVGMRLNPERDRGHCWLSFAGQPFCEMEKQVWPGEEAFYSGPEVRYWVCVDDGATPMQRDLPPSMLAERGYDSPTRGV